MSKILFPLFNRAQLDATGRPRPGYTLTFEGGIPDIDASGEFTQKNPITTNSRGECPPVWLDPDVSYTVTVKDSAGATVRTYAGIPSLSTITAIRGLSAENNPGSPATKIDITFAGALISRGVAAYASRVIAGTTFTADISVAGPAVNGRDQAAEFSPHSVVYVYLIYNQDSGAVASILSASGTAPTMPSGYTHYGLVTAWRVNAVVQFLTGYLRGKHQYFRGYAVLNAGTATTDTIFDSVSTAAVSAVIYIAQQYRANAQGTESAYITAGYASSEIYQLASHGNSEMVIADSIRVTVGSGHMYYRVSVSSVQLTLVLQGYEINSSAVQS